MKWIRNDPTQSIRRFARERIVSIMTDKVAEKKRLENKIVRKSFEAPWHKEV